MTIQRLALWALLLAAGIFTALNLPAVRDTIFTTPSPVQVHSQGPTVERLERLAQLVTMRVYVADVLTAESQGYRGAWLIRGDALIGVDLSRAQITEKDKQTRQATVLLPPPRVLLSRVDHDRTKTWEVRRTAWVPWHGDQDALRDGVMFHAQRLVADASASAENHSRAKATADAVIRGFYEEVGWHVRVLWDEETNG